LSCQEKVGEICSFCCEWTGPPIERYPKPVPDHSCLPEYHYVSYQKTPKEGCDPDDWQPRVQAKKEHGSGRLVLYDPESVALFADKFIVKSKFVVDYLHLEVLEFKRKKRAEEKAKLSRDAKDKSYEDYPGTELCEDLTKLKKLRVPELNKYLNHHGLKQHLKSSKSEKVKAIVRHSCLQQKSPLRAGQPSLRNARTLTQNDNRASADSSETDESDNDEYDSDAIDSGGEDDSSDVILAFINSDEKDANERPNATRSGRAITRRSEIDFSFF